MKIFLGKVIKTEGELALVRVLPENSPCAACKSPCHAGSCSKLKETELWALNEHGAKVGDGVKLCSSEDRALVYGMICLILPLAIAAAEYAATAFITDQAVRVVLCACSFLLSVFVCGMGVRIFAKKHPDARIIAKEQ